MNCSLFSFVRNGVDAYCQAAKQHVRQWTKPDNHDPVLNAAMDLIRRRPHVGIGQHPTSIPKALALSGRLYPRLDRGRRLAQPVVRELLVLHLGHLDVDVDAVQQGAGVNFRPSWALPHFS
jgi:hypothetical protein